MADSSNHLAEGPGVQSEPEPIRPAWRPRRRSLWALGAMALGVVVGLQAEGVDSGAWFAAGSGLLALTAGTGRGRVGARIALATLWLAVVMLAAGWTVQRAIEAPGNRLDGLMSAAEDDGAGRIVTVEGMVVSGVERSRGGEGSLLAGFSRMRPGVSFRVRVESLVLEEGRVACGGVVWVSSSASAARGLKPGDWVRVMGRYQPVVTRGNPGSVRAGADARAWAKQAGRVGRIDAPSGDLIEELDEPRGLWATAESNVRRGVWELRAAARRALRPGVDDERAMNAGGGVGGAGRVGGAGGAGDSEGEVGRALVAGLLLGERDPMLDEARGAFMRLGIVHILAISGFHLTVLAWLPMVLARGLSRSGWVEPVVTGVLVAAYMAVVPAEAPVLRAGFGLLIFLAAEASGRRYDRLTMLGWIACALIVWKPLDVLTVGFQLSFGVVGALIWLGESFKARMFGRPLRGLVDRGDNSSGWSWVTRTAWDKLKGLVSSSVLAWGVATPTVMFHAGVFSPLAVLASVVVTPVVTVVMWAGFCVMCAGAAWEMASGGGAAAPSGMSEWASGVVGAMGSGMLWLVELLDSLPGSAVDVARVSWAWTAFATGVVMYWLARGRARSWLAWGLVAAAVAWLAVEWRASTRLDANVAARVDMLNVGDGTCVVLRSGGEAMLWDCGSLEMGLGVSELPRALRALGVMHVERAVVTHPNLDHYSALPEVAARVGLRELLVSRATLVAAEREPGGAVSVMLRALGERGVHVREVSAGEVIGLGQARVRVLSPSAGATFTLSNDHSVVGALEAETGAGPRRVLLTGDIQAAAMIMLMAGGEDLHAAALELPHHGSYHATAGEFFDAVEAQVVLQSTGRSRLGDPRWASRREGRAWYATAHDGAPWVELMRDGNVRHGTHHARHAPNAQQ